MGKETRPSKRTEKTLISRDVGTHGIFKVKRFNITKTPASLVISARVKGMIVRNDGSQDIAIREVGASPSNYFTISVGDPALHITITDKIALEAQTGSGASKLECIFWG